MDVVKLLSLWFGRRIFSYGYDDVITPDEAILCQEMNDDWGSVLTCFPKSINLNPR